MPVKPQLLSPEQEAIVREALIGGATRCEAAALIGITRQLLDTRLRAGEQLGDLRVGRGRRRGGGAAERGPDPTPEEIAFRAAMIRRSWGPERYLPMAIDLQAEDSRPRRCPRPSRF